MILINIKIILFCKVFNLIDAKIYNSYIFKFLYKKMFFKSIKKNYSNIRIFLKSFNSI